MDGYKARKFRVSDEGISGEQSLGKRNKKKVVERGEGFRVFNRTDFWERWNVRESREMCVKLSTFSTGICG